MTFPSVVAATGYVQSSDTTSWAVYTGVNVNHGSILIVSAAGLPTLSTASSGWSKLGQQNHDDLGIDDDIASAVFYKTADTASDSFTLDSTIAKQFSAVLIRVSGGGTVSGSSSSTSNPPNHSIASTRDVLWVTAVSAGGTDIAAGAPSGYSGLTTAQGFSDGVSTSIGYKTATASSDNPGLFSGIIANGVASWTIALYASRNRRSSGFL